jgi:hypothetical protein
VTILLLLLALPGKGAAQESAEQQKKEQVQERFQKIKRRIAAAAPGTVWEVSPPSTNLGDSGVYQIIGLHRLIVWRRALPWSAMQHQHLPTDSETHLKRVARCSPELLTTEITTQPAGGQHLLPRPLELRTRFFTEGCGH